MRVIGGVARGMPLRAPRGRATRPTADRVREAIFNSVQAWVAGSRFLDLFAGSGAVGIEALSRGAARVVLVEQRREALAAIRANLEKVGLEERALVVAGEVERALDRLVAGDWVFDLVFLDPPYGGDLVAKTLQRLARGPLLTPGAHLVVETGTREAAPRDIDGLSLERQSLYGDTKISYYLGGYPDRLKRW